MIFGLKAVDFELISLLNDDEKTPISMIGKKMVPILEYNNSKYMAESLDIVKYIDENFGGDPLLNETRNNELANWLQESREYVYKLAMPRWPKIGLEEFETKGAIEYFTNKKEAMIGSFDEKLAESDKLIQKANKHLLELENIIDSKDYAISSGLSYGDIDLFPTLRSLSCVKGISFPEKVGLYSRNISNLSGIEMHFDKAI
jgi:glutaredoxin 2